MQAVYFPWEALALHGEDEAQTHGAANYQRSNLVMERQNVLSQLQKSLMRSSSITPPTIGLRGTVGSAVRANV
jgi:hypothetical protein